MTNSHTERDDRAPLRKITPAAERRMQQRTAQEQLMDVLRELREPEVPEVPYADDSSATRDEVMR